MPDTSTISDASDSSKIPVKEPSSAQLFEDWLKEITHQLSQRDPAEAGKKDCDLVLDILRKESNFKAAPPDDVWHRLTEKLDEIWETVKYDTKALQAAPFKPPVHPKNEQPTIDLSDPFDKKGWHEDISPAGIDQGGYGDCFFLSALASIANTEEGKKRIRGMISTNADGSYKVTFPGDSDHPVTVTAAELEQAGTTNGSTWANILETAFLKYNWGDGTRRNVNETLPTVQKMPLLGKAASAQDALALLTNESITTDQLAFLDIGDRRLGLGATSKENLAEDLERALAAGEPITAVTAGDWMKYLGGNSPGAIAEFHVFSVLSYDPKTETVIVRNPWGHNNDTALATEGSTVDGITNLGDGQLSMSLDTFMEHFSDVHMAGAGDYTSTARHIFSDMERTASHAKNAIVDLLHGDLSEALDEGFGAARNYYSLASDELHLTTNAIWDIGSKAVHMAEDTAETVADGIETAASAIASGAQAVCHSYGSVASDAWDTISSWL